MGAGRDVQRPGGDYAGAYASTAVIWGLGYRHTQYAAPDAPGMAHPQMARRGGVVMHAKKGKKAAPPVVEDDDEEDEYEEVEEEVEVEVEEEVEETTLVEKEVVVDRPMQGMVTSVQAAAPELWAKPAVRNGAMAAGVVLGATLLWSVYQVVLKYRCVCVAVCVCTLREMLGRGHAWFQPGACLSEATEESGRLVGCVQLANRAHWTCVSTG